MFRTSAASSIFLVSPLLAMDGNVCLHFMKIQGGLDVQMPGDVLAMDEDDQGASSVEVYGFIGWVTTLVGYVLYLLWAFLPTAVFESIGITYYPDKHWALTGHINGLIKRTENGILAVPTLLCLAIVYVFTGYEFLNMAIVQSPRDRTTIEDSTPQWTGTEVIMSMRE